MLGEFSIRHGFPRYDFFHPPPSTASFCGIQKGWPLGGIARLSGSVDLV